MNEPKVAHSPAPRERRIHPRRAHPRRTHAWQTFRAAIAEFEAAKERMAALDEQRHLVLDDARNAIEDMAQAVRQLALPHDRQAS